MLRRAQALESACSPCVAFRHDAAFSFYTAVDAAQTSGFLSQILIWPSPAGTSDLICFTGELSICLFSVIILNTDCHTRSLCTHQSTATISLQLGVPPYQTSRVLRSTQHSSTFNPPGSVSFEVHNLPYLTSPSWQWPTGPHWNHSGRP